MAVEVSIETVLAGLSHPASVAIRPGGTAERYEVFVADSGSRRVVKMSSSEPNRSTDAITEFPNAAATDKKLPEGNPFGLLFLDEKHLVAGIAGAPPDLRLYELTEAGRPLNAGGAKQKVTPKMPGEESEDAFGSCVGLARTRSNDFVADMLVVAFGGTHHVNGLWKVPVRANMLGEMSRLESRPPLQVLRPTALAVSERGHVLAVDTFSRLRQNRLMFLNPINDQVVLDFQPDLRGISGVAYSPKSGNLYALATEYGKDEECLFRLDDARQPGEQQITITKLADIKRPVALVFAPDGVLYVTTLGDKSEKDAGALLKVTGDL
jgi:hypothetical protein